MLNSSFVDLEHTLPYRPYSSSFHSLPPAPHNPAAEQGFMFILNVPPFRAYIHCINTKQWERWTRSIRDALLLLYARVEERRGWQHNVSSEAPNHVSVSFCT